MASVNPALWPSLKIVQVYGANTNVGKTVVTTAISRALSKNSPIENSAVRTPLVRYLKPVSTGPDWEADEGHLARNVPGISTKCLFQFSNPVSPHIAARESGHIPSDTVVLKSLSDELQSYANYDPITQQFIFIETAGGPLSPGPSGTPQANLYRPFRFPILLVADSRLGGISSTISAYESLMMRGYDVVGIFVFNDANWGNYSYLKDYFSQNRTANPMADAVPFPTQLFSLPMPPIRAEWKQDGDRTLMEARDRDLMSEYYANTSESTPVRDAISLIAETHDNRIKSLHSLGERGHKSVWYPFKQHQGQKPEDIRVFDSAYGDYFHTLCPSKPSAAIPSRSSNSILTPMFDASASWWTQGLGHGNSKLALTAAYAAGRYGHVMFAGAANEPAIGLVEDMLHGMEEEHHARRLTRGFYSDDGSTAVEVALKMALRAFEVRTARCGTASPPQPSDQVGKDTNILVLGLRGSYHGDTIGVMNCSEPNVYNESVTWYSGNGFWFDFPTVTMQKGVWVIEWPESLSHQIHSAGGKSRTEHKSLDAVFDIQSRLDGSEGIAYRVFIQRILEAQVKEMAKVGKRFGTLIIEPIILGAAGMVFADPLFQATLVQLVRQNGDLFGTSMTTLPPSGTTTDDTKNDEHSWKGLPVIFDEVFTGLYRLGRFSSSSLLLPSSTSSTGSSAFTKAEHNNQSSLSSIPITPDISTHAKLLTGGLLPLSLTLTSDSIFDAFLGDSARQAFLHGHSYTAHPIGCYVARQSLQSFRAIQNKDTNIDNTPPSNNNDTSSHSESTPDVTAISPPGEELAMRVASREQRWSAWTDRFVTELSHMHNIEGAYALGTVLAIIIRPEVGHAGGYMSSACSEIQKRLLTSGEVNDFKTTNMYIRNLGNVLYLMASHVTSVDEIAWFERTLQEALNRPSE